MKYTKEQRLDIGRQIYTREITVNEAMTKYNMGRSAAQLCQTNYKRANGIPLRNYSITKTSSFQKSNRSSSDIEEYMTMSKEELIDELIRAKVNEARAKKGYEVKGVGANKVYSSLNNKNSKS